MDAARSRPEAVCEDSCKPLALIVSAAVPRLVVIGWAVVLRLVVVEQVRRISLELVVQSLERVTAEREVLGLTEVGAEDCYYAAVGYMAYHVLKSAVYKAPAAASA